MKVNAKSILAVAGLSCLLGLSLPPSVAAHGTHHPRATRVDQVRRHGDAKMTKRVAGHVVKEAILRYQLQGVVSKEDVERAKKEMYKFLKWKLGGPAPVAGQYISTGYKHFEKAYTDEAGGILLGVISFENVQPELVMPKWMQESLKKQAGESGPAIAGALAAYGVPMPLAQMIGSKVAEVLTKGLQRNVAGFIPKSYDVDNRLVRAAVKARKEAGLKPTQPAGEVADEDEDEPPSQTAGEVADEDEDEQPSPPPQPTAQPGQPATQPSQPAATEKHRVGLTNYADTPVTVTVNGTWLGQWDTHSGWQPLEGVLAGKNEVTVEVQGTPDKPVKLELEAQRGDVWVNLLRLNFQGKTGAHTLAFVAR